MPELSQRAISAFCWLPPERLAILVAMPASLSGLESEKLFSIVRDLSRDGVAILYVSHRLEEVLELCERMSWPMMARSDPRRAAARRLPDAPARCAGNVRRFASEEMLMLKPTACCSIRPCERRSSGTTNSMECVSTSPTKPRPGKPVFSRFAMSLGAARRRPLLADTNGKAGEPRRQAQHQDPESSVKAHPRPPSRRAWHSSIRNSIWFPVSAETRVSDLSVAERWLVMIGKALLLEVNLRGIFYGLKYQIPHMIEKGGGAIVNTSSLFGVMGFATTAVYCASKWSVIGLTNSAALEVARKNIRINAIAPGSVMTPLIKNMFGGEQAARDTVLPMIPMGRISDPSEIAQLVLFLSSDAALFITGQAIVIDGGGFVVGCRSTLAGARRHIQRLRRWLEPSRSTADRATPPDPISTRYAIGPTRNGKPRASRSRRRTKTIARNVRCELRSGHGRICAITGNCHGECPGSPLTVHDAGTARPTKRTLTVQLFLVAT
jgi:hypothetical protein